MPRHSADAFADLALVALVVAYGADAALNRREAGALLDELRLLEPSFSGSAEAALERAAAAYRESRVEHVEEAVGRLGVGLDARGRVEAFDALVSIAEADGAVRTMEATLLRHIGQAWGLRPAKPSAQARSGGAGGG